MKEIKRDNKAPLFLQIAQELGRLRLQGHRPNRLLINKSLKSDFNSIEELENIFQDVEILFTDEDFDFSFEQVIKQFKFIK